MTRDLIIADLQAGRPYGDIAVRHQVSHHTVKRIATERGLDRPRPTQAKRPERPCVWCGRTTVSKDATCASCAAIRAKATEPGYEDALVGGRWVRHGLILRWQPQEVA